MSSTFQIQNLNGDAVNEKTQLRRMMMLCGAGIMVFGAVYLGLMNRVSLMGYALQEVRAEAYDLRTELEKMEIELANEGTLFAFGTSRQVQNLVHQKEKIYVTQKALESLAYNE